MAQDGTSWRISAGGTSTYLRNDVLTSATVTTKEEIASELSIGIIVGDFELLNKQEAQLLLW